MEKAFLYGAATSAHQVEGNNVNNDWWDWEQKGGVAEPSGRAADNYRRYKEDIELAYRLGHNCYRFSIEWSRVEPEQGKWDKQAIGHYRELVGELKRRRMVPFVTLHHFTNPLWFASKGGWKRKDAPELFARYVKVIVDSLGEAVDFWITINEPMVYTAESYWLGRWLPQEKNLRSVLRVSSNLAKAHCRAYRILKTSRKETQVGIAKHVVAYRPGRRNLWDQIAVKANDWWFNDRFLNMLGGSMDFIGVNYYFAARIKVRWWPLKVEGVAWQGSVSDLGWAIYPDGLRQILVELKRYKLPLYVTESGVADAKDRIRADFIRDHIRAVEEAQRQGSDVRGYFYWSLLDNFEWDKGFEPRFGLVAVDYKTMERKVRSSAYAYKAIIDSALQLQ